MITFVIEKIIRYLKTNKKKMFKNKTILITGGTGSFEKH